jgi:tetratricopeptide (TPR) repeat protein
MDLAEAIDKESPIRLRTAINHATSHFLLGNHARAIALYDALTQSQQRTADVVLGQAQCHYALGDYAKALEGFRAVGQALRTQRNDRYWLCELRTLQIFDKAQRNTDRIVPTIERLRLTTKDFTSNPFFREFAALERQYER